MFLRLRPRATYVEHAEFASRRQQMFSPHITSVQYYEGCSVHWKLFSTRGGRGGGEKTTVLKKDSFSTVGGGFSTMKVVQYSGDTTSVHAGG